MSSEFKRGSEEKEAATIMQEHDKWKQVFVRRKESFHNLALI